MSQDDVIPVIPGSQKRGPAFDNEIAQRSKRLKLDKSVPGSKKAPTVRLPQSGKKLFPRTKDLMKRVNHKRLGYEAVNKAKEKAFGPMARGTWRRKKGGDSYYKALDGETYEGPEAGQKAAQDKLALKRREQLRIKADSPTYKRQKRTEAEQKARQKGLDPKQMLSHWEIPESVERFYAWQKQVQYLYKWQAECLSMPGVFEGDANLVYTAPTSGGKSIVAEILMLRRILKQRQKVIYVLPFVALVVEKTRDLQEKLSPLGYLVNGFYQHRGANVAELDIAICTIEKANGVINGLLEQGLMDEVGLVIMDELHMIGDPKRGYIMEISLSKLPPHVQVVGMSATLQNADVLAKWLKAELYKSTERPVPLKEHYLNMTDKKLRDKNGKVIRTFESKKVSTFCLKLMVEAKRKAGERISEIDEAKPGCGQALIFCPTRKWCEHGAQTFYDDPQCLKVLGCRDNPKLKRERQFVVERLRQCEVRNIRLMRCVSRGIAWHNAELTTQERVIVEDAYHKGTISVLCCTSTLAAGVNLPANIVIIREPKIGIEDIDIGKYRQMAGRAGRKGMSDLGTAIIMCSNTKQVCLAKKLLRAQIPPVKSALHLDVRLSRCVLEAIAGRAIKTKNETQAFVKRLLVYSEQKSVEAQDAIVKRVMDGLEDLIKERFVIEDEWTPSRNPSPGITQSQTSQEIHSQPVPQNDPGFVSAGVKAALALNAGHGGLNQFGEREENAVLEDEADVFVTATQLPSRAKREKPPEDEDRSNRISPTQLGLATMATQLTPEDGMSVYQAVREARKNLMLSSNLQYCILSVPTYAIQSKVKWDKYSEEWGRLTPDEKEVGIRFGIDEGQLHRWSFRAPPYKGKTPEEDKKISKYRKFWTALILLRLCEETPLSKIQRRFDVPPGRLQQLQGSAASFATSVASFCAKINWTSMSLLLQQFAECCNFGTKDELLPLLSIEGMKTIQARALYDGGIRDHEDVMKARKDDIVELLRPTHNFKTGNTRSAEERERRQLVLEETASILQTKANLLFEREIREMERQIKEEDLEERRVRGLPDPTQTQPETQKTQLI